MTSSELKVPQMDQNEGKEMENYLAYGGRIG